ncbi:MAG: 2-hydroxyacyl-CoA dehydratase [Candidatus Fermentibacter sp.]|mgnify:FL=1|jgi:benzoyl-CoA reductase/2-hydroxyglutaryl-CoA dehydratase subunit BcrC/BadD/HgdB|nr:MAG: hypothetical protein AO396_06650 [Candidatus Fermentibacter daniensis]KZD15646.1 MAG: hypothetical protein AO395_05575 [Candidatus Fermentibacter daniensis]KZD18449.1 MAG: hypothetical protein AO394_03175 [Candidatus Fermentibacter daniensis]MBP7720476.1 2-hydroxyacyl-CoA dehydratase [Candidatus Fermentibacter sp.]NLI02114.1 2-hydroxyacyl-CoA dehydratase [Candidatus Fermentibacter daniensis]
MRSIRVLHGASSNNEGAGERFMRPDSCPLVKSFAGAASAGTGLHGMVDAWVAMYTCDQTRRLFQALGRITAVDAFHIQLPSTRTKEAEDYFASQVERLCDDLVSRGFSDGYSTDRALAFEKERRRAASSLRSIAMKGLLKPSDLHKAFELFQIARPGWLAGFLETAVAASKPWQGSMRIAVAGGPMAAGDDAVPGLLEAAGVTMVPLGCSGLQATLPDAEPVDGSPGWLAREYFQASRCARCRPNDQVFEYLERTLEEADCRGLILKTLKFCDLWYTERERIRERMPVPVLVLDTSYAPGGRERVGTRIEAFLESLA